MSEESKTELINLYFCIKDNIEYVIEKVKQNIAETFISIVRRILE